MRVPIKDIHIGDRHRKDMGDLSGLAESITAQGLLQPVGITVGRELVFGERRIRVCWDILGWSEIEAREVDVTSIIDGEHDETATRAGFTSRETARLAEKVVTNGVPELVGQMDRGEVSISHAAKVSSLPAETQREVVAHPPAQQRDVVREFIEKEFGQWTNE